MFPGVCFQVLFYVCLLRVYDFHRFASWYIWDYQQLGVVQKADACGWNTTDLVFVAESPVFYRQNVHLPIILKIHMTECFL